MNKVSERGTSIMSVAMSSRDGPELVDTSAADIMTPGVTITPDHEIEAVYEVERCRAWIQQKSLAKVALQFPDHLLPDSALVTARLQARVGAGVRLYILGDTTYGQCCVDEIAAEHVSAEAVIHFGPTCLTATCRLPALWIFTRKSCDTSRLEEAIRDKARDVSSPVVLLYDVEYDHILRDFSLDGISLVVGRCDLWENSEGKLRKFGRTFDSESEEELNKGLVIYVGTGESSLMNFIYSWPEADFFVFENDSLVPANISIGKFLMKRYFLVEKAKDAERVGLLVGTLGTERYTDIIERVKTTGKSANKKVYVFLVGKPNVAKLANFPEIDVYVLVACPETSLIDSKEFLQPIVTPYEFELACNKRTQWAGKLLTDYKDVLVMETIPRVKAADGDSALESDEEEGDMSLITGKIRASCNTGVSEGEGQLSVINDKTIR